MKVEYDGKIFSNEELKIGDEVYPIGWGKVEEDGSYTHQEYDFTDFASGYPDEPHIIKNLHYSNYKPYEVHTSHGWGPKEIYYKIIKE